MNKQLAICRFFGLILFLLLHLYAAHAQNGLGSWNILNLKWEAAPRLTLFTEAQLRSLSFYNQFHYYEWKGGVGYDLDKNFTFLAGVGTYNTYAAGGNFVTPAAQREVRTWAELTMKQHLDRLKFEHRYRAEQRFTNKGYRNRFRYRLGLVAPLNKPAMTDKTLYAALWNELFFTNRAPYFERNRFFIGAGYKTGIYTLQSGWVHQFDYRIIDETGRDFFLISLGITLGKKPAPGSGLLPLQEG